MNTVRRISQWMQRTVWLAAALVIIQAALVVWWALDREPPFEYLDHQQVEVLDADTVRLEYQAVRHRSCDLSASRYVTDSAGFRWYLVDQTLRASDVKQLDFDPPGKVRLVLPIPAGARRGDMAYVAMLEYRCNPLHTYWPITVMVRVPFRIG